MALPSKEVVVEVYSSLVDEGNVDEANFFLAVVTGYAAYLWRRGIVNSQTLSKYFDELRTEILEGPDYLNPFLMEILGIGAEGLDDVTFREMIDKLRMLLREERRDRLEV